jgi:hypothetical protein
MLHLAVIIKLLLFHPKIREEIYSFSVLGLTAIYCGFSIDEKKA